MTNVSKNSTQRVFSEVCPACGAERVSPEMQPVHTHVDIVQFNCGRREIICGGCFEVEKSCGKAKELQ